MIKRTTSIKKIKTPEETFFELHHNEEKIPEEVFFELHHDDGSKESLGSLRGCTFIKTGEIK